MKSPLRMSIMIMLMITAEPAFAQQPVEYQLKVTPAETDIISEGLQTQPFGKVFPLINKLREQIIAQQPKPVVADPPKSAPSAIDLMKGDVTCANPENHCYVDPSK